MLGVAEKIVVTKDNTTIVNGAGTAEEIGDRVNSIKSQIESSQSDYEREKMHERLAKLSGGVSVLYIGAGSEVELKEKKDRVDDALQATKAAIEEGVVEGGGIALLRTIKSLVNVDVKDGSDEQLGVEVISQSLKAPITQILENAGIDSKSVVDSLLLEEGKGYNAKTGEFVNMIADGVIDPKKVTRTAIQNAASVVGMILTTECMVVDKPNEKEDVQPKQMLMG